MLLGFLGVKVGPSIGRELQSIVGVLQFQRKVRGMFELREQPSTHKIVTTPVRLAESCLHDETHNFDLEWSYIAWEFAVCLPYRANIYLRL